MALLKARKGKERQLQILIEHLPKAYSLRDDGALQFLLDTGRSTLAAITACLQPPAGMAFEEFRKLIGEAVRIIFKDEAFTFPALQSAASPLIRSWQKTPEQKYALWCRASFEVAQTIRLRFDNADVTLLRSLPSHMREGFLDPSDYNEEVPGDFDGPVIRVEGKFKSQIGAGYRLVEKLENFIALANVWNSRFSDIVFPTHRRAALQTGPAYYLKGPHGYSETYWRNTEYVEGRFNRFQMNSKQLRSGLTFVRFTNRRLKRNPLARRAVRAAQLLNQSYQVATSDQRNLLVWSAYEQLFGSSEDENRGTYRRIAERAAKLDSLTEVRKAHLECLADKRNIAAHNLDDALLGHSDPTISQEGARYCEWLISWHVQNGHRFSSRNEFLEFIDLPKDTRLLDRKLRLLGQAKSHWQSVAAKQAKL